MTRSPEHQIPPGTAPEMLDDPGLSRQWVLRRLQKALTTDLALSSFLDGLAPRVPGTRGAILAQLAASSRTRTEVLEASIRHEGGTPYSSVGLARAASRIGGVLAARLGIFVWGALLGQAQEHTVSELDALVALVRDAPGVGRTLAERLAPLVARATDDLRSLETLRESGPSGVS